MLTICARAAVLAAALLHGVASAGTVDIDFVEGPAGVEMSGGGTITLTGLSLLTTTSNSGLHFVNPLEGGFGMGALG